MSRWLTGFCVALSGCLLLASCAPVSSPGEAGLQAGALNGEWRVHQGDKAATHYAPLDQIRRDNVGELEIAWRWTSIDQQLREENEELQRISRIYKHEATPLMVDGVLYTVTSMGQIVALEPETGETLWSYDPKTWEWGRPLNLGFITRGLSYWNDGEKKRLLYASNDAYLMSIDIETAELDPAFGDGGKVDLTQNLGVPVEDRGEFLRGYGVNSPVIICRDVVVVGSAIRDTPSRREIPPGHVRGYDVETGEMRWIFHTIPQENEPGNDTWEDGSWKEAGATNVWPPMSADEELGFVYLPVGTPSHNWYGGHRLGTNLYSSSVVAVEAETGRHVWHYQTIHHTLWDYDPVAAPNLLDITVDGKAIKALAQVTKQGFLFVLDRVTGEPVWPIVETAVPQSDIEGERSHPTQPIPSKPAPFEPNGAFEENLIDFTPELRAKALEIFRKFRSGPVYTPPSHEGTIVNPGWAGGGNWNGAAFDPDTQYLYIPSYSDYTVVKLLKPDPERSNFDYIWGGADAPTVDGLPLFKPPWGRITAINMKTGEHVWQVANGDGPRNHPALAGLELGRLGRGQGSGESFPLLTKTLLFTTTDRRDLEEPMIHAYDKANGDLVWEFELPAAVHANPMTYLHQGKQYIVVALGGGLETDELVALALPGSD